MSQIIKSGNTFSLANVDQVKSTLPIGTYNLIYVNMLGFRLEKVPDFTVPSKIYGDLSIINRAITVYKNRDRNFGLLLAGLRGSGKSLLMKKLALELKQPIIILNQSFSDMSDDLIKFLTDPALGDCTILFDEFEKRFDREDPTPLTLMDGPYNTHHFFILTVNTTRINENLINRPGRIYYHKTFNGLDDDTVREVGEDLLKNKDFLDELVDVCGDIRNLSFDMLISVINDVNLFNESPKTCVKEFGFDSSDGMYAKVYQILKDEKKSEVTENAVWLNPTDKYLWVEDIMYYLNDGTTRETDIRLDLSHMQKVSKSKYRLSFELTPQRARLDDEDKDKFETQTLEFEINLNPNREVQYIF
jgi:hypothetical protein